jgi:acyl dehydratase
MTSPDQPNNLIPGDLGLSEDEISDGMLLRSKVGVRLDDPNPLHSFGGAPSYYTEASRDAIVHYALGIDDRNPLWLDEAYANSSSVGRHVALPSLLFALAPGGMSPTQYLSVGPTLGRNATWGGSKLKWYEWIPAGTRIMTESYLEDVTFKRSRLAGAVEQITVASKYLDTAGRLLAESESWCFHMKDFMSPEITPRELQRWSPEEVGLLRREKAAERRRGPEPRYWEDVSEGDTFTLLKGPLTMMASFCYVAVWHPTHVWRGDVPWDDLDSRGVAISSLGFPDVDEPHRNVHDARRRGLAGPFDVGPQRNSWAAQLLTDWMGDSGFLEELRFRVEGFNFLGDIQRFTGRVDDKAVVDGSCIVRCSIESKNQLDKVGGTGTAVVRLPSRTSR